MNEEMGKEIVFGVKPTHIRPKLSNFYGDESTREHFMALPFFLQ
jgi:hypothetical protein